jgi:hypothetical protein
MANESKVLSSLNRGPNYLFLHSVLSVFEQTDQIRYIKCLRESVYKVASSLLRNLGDICT